MVDSMTDDDDLATPDHEFDRLIGVFADGVVGAISGLVGMTLLTGSLFVAERLGGFDSESMSSLAELANLDVFGPPVVIGFAIFWAHGLVTWPLLFASFKQYLPGSAPVGGVLFGLVLWTGFLPGFYAGYQGTALALFVGFSLIGHVAYGLSLGLVFSYLTDRPDSIV